MNNVLKRDTWRSSIPELKNWEKISVTEMCSADDLYSSETTFSELVIFKVTNSLSSENAPIPGYFCNLIWLYYQLNNMGASQIKT